MARIDQLRIADSGNLSIEGVDLGFEGVFCGEEALLFFVVLAACDVLFLVDLVYFLILFVMPVDIFLELLNGLHGLKLDTIAVIGILIKLAINLGDNVGFPMG